MLNIQVGGSLTISTGEYPRNWQEIGKKGLAGNVSAASGRMKKAKAVALMLIILTGIGQTAKNGTLFAFAQSVICGCSER
jgi:hypothetical protein